MKRILLILALPLMLLTAAAQHTLDDINITVELKDNGDARITEERKMNVVSEGTEGYIVIQNLTDSEVRDLAVKDERGNVFVTEPGDWDIARSRAAKAHRCGIHRTSKGYELCWGLGEEGDRVYTVEYTVTSLVKSYDDADGFNFMFVARKLKPQPQHVRLSISKADSPFNLSSTQIWGFGFKGNINIIDGKVVEETTEPFSSESSMIALVRFDKGIFHPSVTINESFENVIDRAKEGSDYGDDDDEGGGGDLTWDEIWSIIITILIVGPVLVITFIIEPIKARKLRKRLLGDEKLMPWYRNTPVNGELLRANNIMNALYNNSTCDNLMAAHILRFIYKKIIVITTAPNWRGKPTKMLAIKEYNITPRTADELLSVEIHNLLYTAAGDDHILQPKELKNYIKRHAESLQPLVKKMQTKAKGNSISEEEAKQVVGLKKFLEEFTLSGERHVEEVTLWKNYLIFATLYGIADQVRKDMKAMCPEYMEMDSIANAMVNNTEDAILFNNLMMTGASTSSFVSSALSRSSGGGGSVSFGGGGGFSGGGSGGGAR